TLLDEADRTSGTHETPYYARQLPAMVRTALAADDLALAERLVDGLEPHYPLDAYALLAARAQPAQGPHDPRQAATLYADARGRRSVVLPQPHSGAQQARFVHLGVRHDDSRGEAAHAQEHHHDSVADVRLRRRADARRAAVQAPAAVQEGLDASPREQRRIPA